ncbi:hypothetical protein JG688_00009235 [Phytophthora aleatoria]|uniref:Glutamine amidotransferase domain-containing protein n=1 Tax=Phytophthora aleatoria TaxID=2496075 RepID=A0A8J5IRN0_9STRA|nr:hypothetical protein JG688_00009235 [Phytophthora aleatoria]
MALWSLLFTAALSLSVVVASARGPIIGVFAHPISQHGEYIAASYVKWVESAGGRVVPIPYNAPKAYLEQLLPQINGLLFPGGAATLYSWLKDKPITMNNHEQGVTPERFNQYSSLTDFYTVLATNVDRQGVEFISAFEAKEYPVYAVQFHPEKNSFEYGEYPDGTPYEVVDHSREGVASGQFFANFFIDEARKNELRFENPKEERKALIYNYQTSTITDPGFVESYIFKHDFKMDFWSVQM